MSDSETLQLISKVKNGLLQNIRGFKETYILLNRMSKYLSQSNKLIDTRTIERLKNVINISTNFNDQLELCQEENNSLNNEISNLMNESELDKLQQDDVTNNLQTTEPMSDEEDLISVGNQSSHIDQLKEELEYYFYIQRVRNYF